MKYKLQITNYKLQITQLNLYSLLWMKPIFLIVWPSNYVHLEDNFATMCVTKQKSSSTKETRMKQQCIV